MLDTDPLNVLRHCPRCGSYAFRASGPRSLRCDDCGFHYFINAAAAVAALIADEAGRLLLTTRGVEPGYGMLDLPGGFIDPGEPAEAAVRRELKEELGMEVRSLIYRESAPNTYTFSGLNVYTLDMAFEVVPVTTTGLRAMDDILEYRFYHAGEIDYSRIPAPSIVQFIKNFFEK